MLLSLSEVLAPASQLTFLPIPSECPLARGKVHWAGSQIQVLSLLLNLIPMHFDAIFEYMITGPMPHSVPRMKIVNLCHLGITGVHHALPGF